MLRSDLLKKPNNKKDLTFQIIDWSSNDIYKNVLFDLTRREPIHISPSSVLNFIGGTSIGKFVKSNLFSSKYKLINLASKKSIRVNEIIKILKLEREYKNCLTLPKQKYIINTDRLKSLTSIDSSKDFVLEYIHNQNAIS